MLEPDQVQRAADFGARIVPLLFRLRKARDQGEGLVLESGEVRTLIEMIQVLRGGPDDG